MSLNTYLLFLFIEVIDDDSNKEIEGEEGAKDNEEDEVDVHVNVGFSDGLIPNLQHENFNPQQLCGTLITIEAKACCYSPASTVPPWPAPACSTHLTAVHRRVHNAQPPLEYGHLKKAQVGVTHMVERHRRLGPCRIGGLEALGLVVDDGGIVGVPVRVYALHRGYYTATMVCLGHAGL